MTTGTSGKTPFCDYPIVFEFYHVDEVPYKWIARSAFEANTEFSLLTLALTLTPTKYDFHTHICNKVAHPFGLRISAKYY